MTHKPGDEIVIVFEDQTKATRSDQGITLLLDRMNQVAKENGFQLAQVGNRVKIRKAFNLDFNDTEE